jgi:hypothetical protein
VRKPLFQKLPTEEAAVVPKSVNGTKPATVEEIRNALNNIRVESD